MCMDAFVSTRYDLRKSLSRLCLLGGRFSSTFPAADLGAARSVHELRLTANFNQCQRDTCRLTEVNISTNGRYTISEKRCGLANGRSKHTPYQPVASGIEAAREKTPHDREFIRSRHTSTICRINIVDPIRRDVDSIGNDPDDVLIRFTAASIIEAAISPNAPTNLSATHYRTADCRP